MPLPQTNDQIAWDPNPVPEKDLLLPVEREVIDVFADEQVSEQASGGQAFDQWRDWCRGHHGGKLSLVFAAELGAQDAASEQLGRGDVEKNQQI